MRRVFTVVAVVMVFAIAIFALRTRRTPVTAFVDASVSVAPPLAEPAALVAVKTTKPPRELRRGDVEVIGVVKDISGGTIGNATVTVTTNSDTSKVGQIVQSDANGEIHAWVDAGEIRATATADGYSGAAWSGVAPGQRIELVMTPESVLQGRVVEAGTDVPVAGALVVADSEDDDVSSKAVTDAEGRFRLRALAPGHYKPEAVTPNRWGMARSSVLLGLAETVNDVVIEVHASLAVSGRVFHGDTGCPGATVGLTGDGGSSVGDARYADADADGNVQVEGVFPGKYEVIVRCTGGVDTTYPPIVVKDANVTGLVWRTETGFSLRGTLFDENGRTVAGTSVAARRDGDIASADTEPDGTFAIHTLRGGSYELITSHANVFTNVVLDTVTVEHDVEGIRLTLRATGGVRGSVVDDRGVAVPGVAVDIVSEGPGNASVKVREDGTFSVDGLSPGPYRLAVTRDLLVLRPASKREHFPAITVTKGSTTTVRLVVEGERGVIRGRVLDSANNPLGDAFVEAARQRDAPDTQEKAHAARGFDRSDFGSAAPVVVEPDGHFTIGKLGPGTYAVRAFRKGGGDAILNGVALGSDVTLVVKDEASISGTLAGAKPDRFTIAITDGETRFSRIESFFRADGAFAIRDLPSGSYDLVAESTDGVGQIKLTLAAGQRRDDLSIPLLAHARIRGRVVGAADGKPVSGLMVLVAMDGAGRNASTDHAKTDSDGRFEIQRVASGAVTVVILGKTLHEQKVTVAPGETVELPTIRFEPWKDTPE